MEEKTAGAKKGVKLNYGRTMLIGLAFLTIMMLWQVYNQSVSLFLKDMLSQKLGDNVSYIVGIIMALDNALALIMLPLFGKLSDRTKTPLGRRMPFILAGTVLAAIAFVFVPVLYLHDSLIGMIVMLLLVIVFMNVFRSPAVALMPDVTVKPLRSKANGIINLMGGIGGGAMMLFMMLIPSLPLGDAAAAGLPFYVTAGLMLVAVAVMFFTVKENKYNEEMLALSAEMGLEDAPDAASATEEEQKVAEAYKAKEADLTKHKKRNFILILAAVFAWFMAFNAIETFLSIYCSEVLFTSLKDTMTAEAYLTYVRGKSSTIMLCFQLAAMAMYIPAGIIASRFGRKTVILVGIAVTVLMFAPAALFGSFTWALLPFFIFAGFAYAAINVNSYPMVVDMSDNSNVGKYTGYYYTASMLAQTVTPVLIGFLLDALGYRYTFFPYAAIFMTVAFFLILFVGKTGNGARTERKRGLEAFDND